MPKIGRPATGIKNNFSDITMLKKPKGVQGNENTGDYLNKISGNKSRIKYVDKGKHNVLGKNEFLKLLAHQMSIQDPMNPMDQKKFASDLAQFSQLEKLTSINESLDKQNSTAPLANKFYAASFLGKTVTTTGTTLEYDGSSHGVEVPFYLPKDAKNLILRIYDSKNQLVGQIEKDQMSKGEQVILWDGRILDNTKAEKGTYNVFVSAWDDSMQKFEAETKVKGTVTGVSFKDGETILKVDGKKSIFLRDVESLAVSGDNKGSVDKTTDALAAMNSKKVGKKLHMPEMHQ